MHDMPFKKQTVNSKTSVPWDNKSLSWLGLPALYFRCLQVTWRQIMLLVTRFVKRNLQLLLSLMIFQLVNTLFDDCDLDVDCCFEQLLSRHKTPILAAWAHDTTTTTKAEKAKRLAFTRLVERQPKDLRVDGVARARFSRFLLFLSVLSCSCWSHWSKKKEGKFLKTDKYFFR